jgi:GTPase SAR1 family protein
MRSVHVHCVGAGGTGKTSFVRRVATGTFAPTFDISQSDVTQLTFPLSGTEGQIQELFLWLWDVTPTNHWTRRVQYPAIYTPTSGVLVLFDLTRPQTLFSEVPAWVAELCPHLRSHVPMGLIGTKLDLHRDRLVGDDEIKDMAQRHHFAFTALTSAADGTGVVDAVTQILRLGLKW